LGRLVARVRELVVGATGVAELVLLSPAPVVRVAKAAYERDRDSGGGLLAGAIAFRLFVWTVAVGVVLVGGLGFARSQGADTDRVSNGSGAPAFILDSVKDVGEGSSRARWLILAVGLYFLFSASRSALRALWTSSSIVWRLPISRPPMAQAVPALNVLLVSLFAVNSASAWVNDLTPGPGVLVRVLAAVVQLGILLVGLRWLPHAPVPWRAIFPGALLVAVGGQLMNLVSTVYLAGRLDTADTTYGSLGTAIVLLAWIYLYGRLLVLGSVLNASMWAERGGRGAGEDEGALAAASLITGAYDRPPAGGASP
jgi:uncharacterized BrkB/YihY/UPF0761 family membrane protein